MRGLRRVVINAKNKGPMNDTKLIETPPIDFNALQAPFPLEEIEWRPVACGVARGGEKPWIQVFPYVRRAAILHRLNTVVGLLNWSDETIETPSGAICRLTIRGVTKSDGAGFSKVEPLKGAISGALKRAASRWGIGQYLYDLGALYGRIHERGKLGPSEIKRKGAQSLWVRWDAPVLPAWAVPEGTRQLDAEIRPEERAPKSISAEQKRTIEGFLIKLEWSNETIAKSKLGNLPDLSFEQAAKSIMWLKEKIEAMEDGRDDGAPSEEPVGFGGM